MKILHLIDVPWWSGLSAYAFDCMTAHINSGHEVWVACAKNSLPYRKALEMHLQVIPIHGREGYNSPFNFFSIGIAVSQKKPDCILAHTGSTHSIAWWWGKKKRIPVIRTYTLSRPHQAHFLKQKIFFQSWRIVTASEKLKEECLGKISFSLKDKIRTVYPPVQTLFHNKPLSIENIVAGRPSSQKKRVGILARLDPVKGHSNLLKAAKIVQETFPETEFHLAGSEENIKWHTLLAESKTLHLKNLFYHGFLARENLFNFLKSCSVGVIASLGSEEVSRTLLEWFSVGVPVVATFVGCIPEILKEREGGFLVPPRSPEKMAQKIVELLSSPTLSEKMGQNNLALCQTQFSSRYFQSEWDNILSVVYA